MRGLTGDTRGEGELAPLARWVHAHERGVIVAYALAVVALFAVLAVWGVLGRGAERAVDAWNDRTARDLAAAEAALAAGRLDEACAALERLDRDHPAVFVKHGRDRERERVLERLGETYVALDRKGKALETFQRLVAFDPRNWRNHYLLGEALRHYSDADGAELAYREVLRIHPNHLPTVETLTGMLFDVATLYAKVVELHRQYAGAMLIAEIELSLGDRRVALDVPVDGRPHVIEAPIELEPGWSGTARLATRGYSARIGRLALTAPLRVGSQAPAATAELGGDDWRATDATPWGDGAFAASSTASALERDVAAPRGAARLTIEVTLYKAMTESLWTKVQTSYRNRLLFDELEDVRARTVVGGCMEAGSIVED